MSVQHKTRLLMFGALWVGMLIGAMGSSIAAGVLGSSLFKDVKKASPYDAAIGEMVNLGVMKGMTSTQFKPNLTVKRGELAYILKNFRDSLNGVQVSASTTGNAASSAQTSGASKQTSYAYNPAGYIRFTTTVFSVNEAVGTAVVTIVRTGGNQGTVSVDYALVPGTAIAGTDYVDSKGTLTFANKETSKKINIEIKDDGTVKPERTLTLELKNPQHGGGIAEPTKATLKILDRFAGATSSAGSVAPAAASSVANAATLSFSASVYAASEEGGSVAITVVRGGVLTSAVSVNYQTTLGSATGGDHAPVSGTLSFAANETTKTFTITIPDDSAVDGSRSVNIFLSGPTGGAVLVNPGTAQLTIADNESMPFGSGSLKFAKAKYEFAEGAGKAVITVMRVGGAAGTAGITYSANGGSATGGTDYTPISGTLTFAANEASKIFEVPLIKDSNADTGETINLTLSAPTGAALGDPSMSIITLYD